MELMKGSKQKESSVTKHVAMEKRVTASFILCANGGRSINLIKEIMVERLIKQNYVTSTFNTH